MFSVWMIPVFAYCIWVGDIFAKRCKAHWMTFLFFPTAFIIAAFFLLLISGDPLCWQTYLISLSCGSLVGLLLTNRVAIKVDVVRQVICAPGSWWLMICLIMLCVLKWGVDGAFIVMPEYLPPFKIMSFGIKGLMTGLLLGQALSFYYRFWIAYKCSPDELTHGRFALFCGMQKLPRREHTHCL